MLGEPSGASHDPPPLTDRYDKARNRYALMAGLLLGWELVGVQFSGEPIPWLGITLASGGGAPYAVLAMLLYFAFRTALEWYQNPSLRQRDRAANLDFIAANLLGVAAIAVFAYQQLAGTQLALTFTPTTPALALLGFVAGFAVGELWRYHREGQTDSLRLIFFLFAGLAVPIGVVALLEPARPVDYLVLSLSLLAGMAFDLGIGKIIRR